MAHRTWAVALSSLLFLSSAYAQSAAPETLTNAAVVKLVKAGFREKTIVSIIGARPTRFDLSSDRLIELKKSGVSERIILAMLARQEAASDFDAGWDDEPLPGGGPGNRSADGARRDPGEINIFGSSGGSRGRVRSRGGSGSAEGDTQTLGSASVRIVRPPAEAGGVAGAPKLEKTPTLTNQSIIDLVEGGFSEGTIVRRIENSPADFDLSPAKLAELRRRRVTEPVISAMRAAMADDAPGGAGSVKN